MDIKLSMTDPLSHLDYVEAYTQGTPNYCIFLHDHEPSSPPHLLNQDTEPIRRYKRRLAEKVATRGLMPNRACDNLVAIALNSAATAYSRVHFGAEYLCNPEYTCRAPVHPRYKTRVACGNCARNKLGCDSIRPCGRCVQSGKADSCEDRTQSKKRKISESPDQETNGKKGKIVEDITAIFADTTCYGN